jgi:hypothetical protein
MTTLDRVLESLAFCHAQDDHLWAAARIVVQQDVDEFVREAGPQLPDQLEALSRLMTDFDARFPGQTDPVLIRSYMRRHIRRIEYALKRDGDRPEGTDELPESPATSPEAHAETHPESTVVPESDVAPDKTTETVADGDALPGQPNGSGR